MSGDLPDGWRRVRLGDVFRERKQRGRAGLPVASVSIEHGLVLRSSLDRRVQSDLPPEGHSLVCKGDIAYNMMRMWQGACGLAQADCLISPAYVVMTPTEEIEPQFADKLLRSQPVIRLLHGYSQGIVDDRLRLYPDAFAQVPISLPPLDEQRLITEVLRSVDDAIAAAQQAAEQSRALQSSLITARCFGHGFEMVRLGDILADIRYGTSVKCDANEADGYPVLRIPNVTNGRVELDDLKYASVSDADLRRFGLGAGDIVVVRTNGNPAHIGRSALITDVADTWLFASYLIRMRFDARRAWPPYVYATLNSQPVREKLFKAATTSAGNYNINTASLKGIAIPLPDLETQHQIGEVIQLATEVANACENEVKQKQRVRASLISDFLSGRVRVPA
ncbi:restriction endonuclease subunit S [Bradyrhizobium sp. Arg314]